MFLPDGAEHFLRLPGCSLDDSKPVYCVVGNRDRTLYAAVTSSVLYIFLANPNLLLCIFKRSATDVEEKGEYRLLYWRHDSSAICLTTSKNYLLTYRVEISLDKQCYNIVESRDQRSKHAFNELFLKNVRPRINISLSIVGRLDSCATCIMPLRDDIFISLCDGWMHRLSWKGVVDQDVSFHLSRIPFATDQLQSKPEHVQDRSIFIVDLVYAPLIGGFCIILSDGRAALITSPTSKFHPEELLAVWAMQLNDAVCCSTNHKFRLIIFGCKNGDITAYNLDDTNGALICTYRVKLHIKNGPELLNMVSSVKHIECFSQGNAFAAVWSVNETSKNVSSVPPVLAIFSPFGAQLWCSLESNSEREIAKNSYRWVDWGPEGFNLWLASDKGISLLPISRSISSSNPDMESGERIIMLSSNKIYLSPTKEREQCASAPNSVWHTFSLPKEYLSTNWPLRMAAFDRDNERILVAAGAHGFVHCSISSGKWRMFGNESQERDMVVTGGINVWDNFILVACYDINRCKEELRFYPVNQQLDNQFCTRYTTDSRILVFSRRGNKLTTFDMDTKIFIYNLKTTSAPKNSFSKVTIERCAEIQASDFLPHPVCIVSIQLTALSQDTSVVKFCDSFDTVLINVSGRVLMLNPVGDISDEDDERFQLSQPMLIASFVEQMWHFNVEKVLNDKRPHLLSALWLNCGSKGMKVWIPLFLNEKNRGSFGMLDSTRSFINKRIMLPFELDIYPLVICSRHCLAIGLESIPSFIFNKSPSSVGTVKTFYNLHRNSEVFLHHLLRQLLKRNLGVYALEIAATCTSLPYFGHVLELLLHNVLEEEATSAEPIPDPLLPRVVAFIREFPKFPQTVAHCARKTELALWHALFAVTSSPKELFEMCIRDDQLETAASFLIVLQNMESSIASREHAAILLEEALMKRRWTIARDIVRFLRAIHPSDIDSPPRTPACQRPHQNVSAVTRRSTLISPKSSDETDSFVFGSYSAPGFVTRSRLYSESTTSMNRKDSTSIPQSKKVSKTSSAESPLSPVGSVGSMHDYLQEILDRHALHLIEDYSIRDLGAFAAHLNFDLIQWLNGRRATDSMISDFPLALMRLHAQFQWPYPLVSQSVVEQLSRKIEGIKFSQSCSSLLSFQSSNNSKVSTPTVEKCDVLANVQLISDDEPKSVEKNDASIQCSSENKNLTLTRSPDSVSYESLSNHSDWEGLERICGENAARGNQESELELKFMLDMMHEVGYTDWAFLLCLLRRDISFLTKRFNANYVEKYKSSDLERLRKGIAQLREWANSSCFGYRAIIYAFERHLDRLELKDDPVWKSSHTTPKEAPGYVEVTVPFLNGLLKLAEEPHEVIEDSKQEAVASNGIYHLSPKQPFRLQTPAASKIVKKTFTPPIENGTKAEQDGLRSNDHSIVGMDVVSPINVDNYDRCVIM